MLKLNNPTMAFNQSFMGRFRLSYTVVELVRIVGSVVLCLILAVGFGFVIAKGGVPVAGFIIIIPFVLIWLIACFYKPIIGLKTCFHISFFLMGIGRFVTIDAPLGLSIDGILLVILLAIIFTAPNARWGRVSSPIFYAVLVWFVFTVLEIGNPESRSIEAWFYAVRAVSLYWIQIVIIGLVLTFRRSDIDSFVNIWLTWSFLAALWGFKQQYIGLTAGEQYWLDTVGYVTHVLFGHMRSWSFYSDAGQFGAAMAHVCLFALIRALDVPQLRLKVVYGVLAGIYFWGFAVAGSRGPLFVIAAGFMFYLLLRKNVAIVVLGGTLALGAYGLLKYTKVGQGNYQVQRIRSALDPNDPSLQQRLINQRKLAVYLSTRPIGGGIGSGGEWGRRFSPGTFLAETALDSWFVKIWVDTGVVGLVLYIVILLVILAFGFRTVWRLQEPHLRSVTSGFYCGVVGILCASYGNQIVGQVPTSIVLCVSMVFVAIAPDFDQPPQVADAGLAPSSKS